MGITSWLKNPLQPITHAIGKTAGITANTYNGVHVDPTRLLTTAEALTGNPYAMAGVAGNAVNTLAPNSTLGKYGAMAGEAGGVAGGMTGGLGSVLSHIPGAGYLSKIPGMSKLGSLGGAIASHLPGGGSPSADGGVPDLNPDDARGMIGTTGDGTPGSGMSVDSGSSSGGNWWDPIISGAKKVGGAVLNDVTGNGGGSGGGGGGGGGGGLNPLLIGGLATAQGALAAKAYANMGNLQDRALNTAQDQYASRAPLRTAGVAGMTAPPVKLNLPSTGNPFQPQAGQ